MIIAILLLGMFAFVAIGIPIAWALGISGFGALILMGTPLHTVPQKIFTGMDCFPLMCIPFFILAGDLMTKGGLTSRLVKFALVIVGGIRGGLALANVIVCMFFGGVTGSGIADSSAVGSAVIPMMIKTGYGRAFSAAITGAAGCMGPIIPPSIPVVVYAMAVGGASIGGMFAAGLVPGVLIGFGLMAAVYVISRRRSYPKRKEKITFKESIIALKDALLALMMPLIILGGIISGIFTPTEAASVAVIYSFVVSYFIYRELRLSDLPEIFLRSGVTSAVVMIIIGTSNVFGLVVAFEQLALKLETILRPMGYISFIIAVNVIFLIVGTFMDQNPAILILAPIFAPIAIHLGMHPIHFGIIVVINLVIGLITPPLGEILFIVGPLARVSIEDVTKEILPFMAIEIVILFLVSYVPSIPLYVPKLLGYIR
jgi:tripartite ATP-independent transporter DctM subunit